MIPTVFDVQYGHEGVRVGYWMSDANRRDFRACTCQRTRRPIGNELIISSTKRPYLPILSFATFDIVHEQAALYFFTYKTASHLWLMPLLNFDSRTLARAPYEQLSQTQTASEDDDDSVLDVDQDQDGGPPKKRKRWWDYLPLCREHHPFDLQIISV